MLRRPVNVGFSGGEKKRNEILQMALLRAAALRARRNRFRPRHRRAQVVSEGVNRLRSPERAIVVITHYQRLLDYIVPDVVHVLSKGRIVSTGGKELALELEANGYAQYPTRRREAMNAEVREFAAGRAMNAEVRQIKTRPRPRWRRLSRRRASTLPGGGVVGGAARGGIRPLRGATGCRIGASRTGNTPTCAR